jgi:polysaccharide export outer membrane protein
MRLAIVSAIALAASAFAQQPSTPQPAAEADYVIGPEDVLDIAVWGNTDVSRTMPVRPDGKISLPLLNDVQAAGLTPMQLGTTLASALERYISSPMVSVIVREVHSFKVTVIGEVKTPGRYELHSRTTVLDVLALAGGFSQYAARSRITILRRQGDTVRELPYDFEKVTKSGSKAGQDNLCVQPGDIIVVP